MNVGERIRYFREKKGVTVNKLANMSGVSQSYLRDVELGNKQPTVEYLGYICDALGVSLAAFFDDTDSLKNAVAGLTPPQREALIAFIHTLTEGR